MRTVAATATGIHHRSYTSELRLRATRAEYVRLALLAVALLVVPFVMGNYWLSIVNTIFIAVIGAVGLNILVGYTGQISLGHGAFMAIGGYTTAILMTDHGVKDIATIPIAIVVTGVAGFLFGLPAYPRAWHDRPLLRVCSKCLAIGHSLSNCRSRSFRCKHCGLHGHRSHEHDRFCAKCNNSSLCYTTLCVAYMRLYAI